MPVGIAKVELLAKFGRVLALATAAPVLCGGSVLLLRPTANELPPPARLLRLNSLPGRPLFGEYPLVVADVQLTRITRELAVPREVSALLAEYIFDRDATPGYEPALAPIFNPKSVPKLDSGPGPEP